jgi:hypothetical protein
MRTFTWSLAPQYHFSDDAMLYGDHRLPAGARTWRFGADERRRLRLTNYEVGFKFEVDDSSLALRHRVHIA